MGVVVAARHIALDERVAIKFLLPDVATNAEMVRRFLREAQAAAKIRSDHVARVIDVGTLDHGAPYMIMEYLTGCDLSDLVEKRGPLPISEAVDYVMQTCEALADAHALGIVHRDVKPANLFLTTKNDGSACIKVLDFGISKVRSPDSQSLTRTQGVMGSPLYMSPEQLTSARDVDHRADVYALGVVLYELLSGGQPYEAEDLPQLIVKILQEQPLGLRLRRPDVPPALEAVILRSIAKDRNARTTSVAELSASLAPFGPHHAQASAERAARISLGSSQNRSAPPPPMPAGKSTLTPVGSTSPPATTQAPGTKSRAPVVAAAMFGVLLLGGLAFGASRLLAHDDKTSGAGEGAPSANGAERKKPRAEKTAHAANDDTTDDTNDTNDTTDHAATVASVVPSASAPKPPATVSTEAAAATTTNASTTAPIKTAGAPSPPALVAKPASKPKPASSSSSKPAPKNDDPFGNHVY